MKRHFRVCTDSSVLNYFFTQQAARQYLDELLRQSPDVAELSYIEHCDRDHDWHKI